MSTKVNGPEPKDGQVWRDMGDGDLLLVVSDEEGFGSRVVVIAEGPSIGYALNNNTNPRTPEALFDGPKGVEYVGMFWEVFALREASA